MEFFINKNIRYIRLQSGMIQEEFAKHIIVTREAMASYEQDVARPPYEVIARISDFFGVLIDDLLRVDMEKAGLEKYKSITKANPPMISKLEVLENENELLKKYIEQLKKNI